MGRSNGAEVCGHRAGSAPIRAVGAPATDERGQRHAMAEELVGPAGEKAVGPKQRRL